jgi:Fe-S-cluster-containing dehydrogenase component
MEVGPLEIGNSLRMGFIVMRCFHCTKPVCLNACPTKAISKRLDGIVVIDADLCTGCKACIEACPFGAPQFNPEKNIVEKCTMCMHRIDKGLKPACVEACPNKAIYFGDINQLTELRRQSHANSFFLVNLIF